MSDENTGSAFGGEGSAPPEGGAPPEGSTPPEGSPPAEGGDARIIEERPDWLDSRFKTAQDLGAAYKELETKFSQTRPQKAPDEYEVTLPDGVSLTDDMVKAFQ